MAGHSGGMDGVDLLPETVARDRDIDCVRVLLLALLVCALSLVCHRDIVPGILRF
jgi:hypothetical protein